MWLSKLKKRLKRLIYRWCLVFVEKCHLEPVSKWTQIPMERQKAERKLEKTWWKWLWNFVAFFLPFFYNGNSSARPNAGRNCNRSATTKYIQVYIGISIYNILYIYVYTFLLVFICAGWQVIRLFLAAFKYTWNYYTFTLGLFIRISNHKSAVNEVAAAMLCCWCCRFVIAVAANGFGIEYM